MNPSRYPVLRRGRLSLLLRPRVLGINLTLLLTTFLLAGTALTQGRLEIPFNELWSTLQAPELAGINGRILLDIRLPRVLTALFAGAALGISGAVFQSLSRNPLGSPDVIGFTTGAATGAIAHILFFGQNMVGILLATISGGLLTALAVYLLTLRNGRIDNYRLVLIGIGVGSTLGALNGLMLVKGSLDSAMLANIWLAGSLNARNWSHALPPLIGTLCLLPLIAAEARKLSLIEMGDDLASQLGVRVESTRRRTMLYGVVLAALATGALGPVSFIALAAPQLVARLTRGSGVPVVGAGLMGAFLLLIADQITQRLPGGLTLPIGRVTAIIGGLYLLWLLTRRGQR